MYSLFGKLICWAILLPITVFGQYVQAVDTAIELDVMTYNIRIASPPSLGWGHTDLHAVADVINRERPDLVALQEVDAYTERSGKASHQAKELAAMTGMYWHFAKAVDRNGGDYGVAVLSRFPIASAQSFRLPVHKGSDGEIRGCALITVLIGGQKVGFMSAHLDHQSDRDRQLQVRAINRILKKYKKLPVIFGADLNMEHRNPVMRMLEPQISFLCDSCALTFPSDTPRVTLDYLMLNKAAMEHFEKISYRVVAETYASDHRPVVSRLRLITK